MAAFPSVSVCIPTYNQADFLSFAVESALHQFDVTTDVYVADDCSTDNTAQLLEKYRADEHFHAISGTNNCGIALNSERVLRAATSQYIVRLDSDDILLPNYCKILSGLLDAYPQAAVAHCAVEEINSSGMKLRTRRLARKTGYQQSETALREAVSGYKVAANICMFRKKALDNLAPIYHPDLHFAEDWDLYTRLAASGWGNVYSSKVLAKYRVWGRSNALNIARKVSEIDGITHVLTKTIPRAWRWSGWNCLPIEVSRRKFATAHLQCLLDLDTQSAEFDTLRLALINLSGSDEDFIDHLFSQLCSRTRNPRSFERALRIGRDCVKSLVFR